ncbi:MAG: YggT family protein [Patescibacteria group bacterium]
MNLNSQLVAILANTVDIFFRMLSLLIIVRILMSWVAPQSRGKTAYFILSTTEPILAWFRKLPLRIGMMDLSPLAALLALSFVRSFLLKLILGL